MCGLVGYLNKKAEAQAPVGEILYKMATGLCRRGPDSAGVALYSAAQPGQFKLRVKLGEHGDLRASGQELVDALTKLTRIVESETIAEYQRLVIEPLAQSGQGKPLDAKLLEKTIEAMAPQFEVVSLGKSLEIIKQVGSPENLNKTYPFRNFQGTHGIGHTRLSTESRVDLSHSQPFWAHGIIDLATVHNGHITNYHKLRRQYEQRGIRFYTENDSEIIGKYLADRLAEEMPLEEALKASLLDLDGSFCYLVATADQLGYVKDPFAFKPLLVIETEDFVAIATEEVALRTWVDARHRAREAGTSELQVWQLSNQPSAVAV